MKALALTLLGLVALTLTTHAAKFPDIQIKGVASADGMVGTNLSYFGPGQDMFDPYFQNWVGFPATVEITNYSPTNYPIGLIVEAQGGADYAAGIYNALFATVNQPMLVAFGMDNDILLQGTNHLHRLSGYVSYFDLSQFTGSIEDFFHYHTFSPVSMSGVTAVSREIALYSPPLGGSMVTNSYGLLIDDQTSSQNNWAIHTGLGKVHFGDTVTAVSGAASLATDTAVNISTTGWTNTFGKNAVVYWTGTAASATVYNNAGTIVATNTAVVGATCTTLLQASGKMIVTAGTAVSGRAVPF